MKLKHSPIIDKDLHTKDIHLIFVEFFEPYNDIAMAEGTHFQFKTKLMMLTAAILLVGLTYLARFPTIPEVLAGIIVAYVGVEAIIFLVNKFQDYSKNKGIHGIFTIIGVLTVVMLVMGIFV